MPASKCVPLLTLAPWASRPISWLIHFYPWGHSPFCCKCTVLSQNKQSSYLWNISLYCSFSNLKTQFAQLLLPNNLMWFRTPPLYVLCGLLTWDKLIKTRAWSCRLSAKEVFYFAKTAFRIQADVIKIPQRNSKLFASRG